MTVVKEEHVLWRQPNLDSNASFLPYLLDNPDHINICET